MNKELNIFQDDGQEGRFHLQLISGESNVVSSLTVDLLNMNLMPGSRCVAIGGIGNVETPVAARGKGYARQLMGLADEFMTREQDCVAGLLYGIEDFYTPLGWRSVGDAWYLSVHVGSPGRTSGTNDLSGGYRFTNAVEDDFRRIADLYDLVARSTHGAIVRTPASRGWCSFESQIERGEVGVLWRENEQIVGYASIGRGIYNREEDAKRWPGEFCIAEAHALDDVAAAELVKALRGWSQQVADGRTAVTFRSSPESLVFDAACKQRSEVRRFIDPTGGCMMKPLGDGANAHLGVTEIHGVVQFTPDLF